MIEISVELLELGLCLINNQIYLCTFSVMCCSFRFLQNIQYTQKKVHVYVCHTYTKKDLNDLDNHDGVVTHLEPEILKYEVN